MRSCSSIFGVLFICLAVWVSAVSAFADNWCEDFLWTFNPDASDVSRCLQAGADVNARDQFGRTPLHNAADEIEAPAVITTLLNAGADVNASALWTPPGESTITFNRGTPLHIAAGDNQNPEVIRALLRAGADLNARNGLGETPLHEAAGDNQNPEVIRALLRAGADLNARDNTGDTPLHVAANDNQNPEVIRALLRAGADLNARDSLGETPLHIAAGDNQNPEVSRALLKAGAELNARDRLGKTPLHEAAIWNENPAVITLFLASGADPNAQDILGLTPLQLVANSPYRTNDDRDPEKIRMAFSSEAVAAFREEERRVRAAEVQERLRKAQVPCDKWNTSGFFRNAGAADVSRCLNTDNHSARNQAGETPLHMVAKLGKVPEVVAAIAKAGADLNARDEKGRTPLHTAALFSKEAKVVAALVRAGADLTVQDKRGRAALELGEKFSKTPAVVAVLREFAVPKKTKTAAQRRDVERRPARTQVSCETWNTPSFFRDAKLPDLIRCLKTRDANARSANGRTPLHYAAQGEKAALVTALAGAGADVNARDERGGWTPLHLAAWFSKTPSVVEALLAVGADPTAKDKVGKTPWDYATQNATLKDTAPYRRLSDERSR
ncbi:MAG: ankyrin repeat domain-containing protein [Deltaproteobacteria bacterium]|nr:ankyrin repeat domain-containing protein [Deltaproteobacteria bacterium]